MQQNLPVHLNADGLWTINSSSQLINKHVLKLYSCKFIASHIISHKHNTTLGSDVIHEGIFSASCRSLQVDGVLSRDVTAAVVAVDAAAESGMGTVGSHSACVSTRCELDLANIAALMSRHDRPWTTSSEIVDACPFLRNIVQRAQYSYTHVQYMYIILHATRRISVFSILYHV